MKSYVNVLLRTIHEHWRRKMKENISRIHSLRYNVPTRCWMLIGLLHQGGSCGGSTLQARKKQEICTKFCWRSHLLEDNLARWGVKVGISLKTHRSALNMEMIRSSLKWFGGISFQPKKKELSLLRWCPVPDSSL